MNSSWFNNKTERVFIINAIPLFEALGNQACLVPLNGAISMFLHLEYPFRVNDIDTRWRWNQAPSVVSLKSMNLLLHRSTPVWNAKCCLKMSWFSCRIGLSMRHTGRKPRNSAISAILRLEDATLAASMRTQDDRRRWRWSSHHRGATVHQR